MLVSEAFELYQQAEIIAGGLSPKTLESYVYAAKLAVNFFGDVAMENIQAMDVRKFYDHLLGWQKPDTARGNIICFRSVIKFLKKKKHSIIDPEDIKIPRREKRKIDFLTASEVEEFIAVLATRRQGYAEVNRLRNIAIAEVIFSSGIRVSELCRLNRNSIKDRQFTVIGKSKNPRLCFISQKAEREITAYLKARNDNNPALFVSNQNNKRITTGNVRKIFQNACNKSSFENIHPHTLRHSFATYMLERNVDLRYIGDLMGHESLDTTKIYTHYTNPKLRQIYDTAMGS